MLACSVLHNKEKIARDTHKNSWMEPMN
uniref:Uncharacterized protein n=1 Tax=Arundo donax TaxID=35708 RepID=A0A0A9FTB0_ARUDO